MRSFVRLSAVGLCACLAAGCGSGSSASSAVQLDSGAKPKRSLVCASRAPRAISLDVAGPPLLRPGAELVRLCRYSGENAPRPLRLLRSRLIRSAALIGGLTRELNTIPERHGVYPCPLDDGSEIVLLARYRRLRPRRVIVGLTGCHFVTNGWTSRLGASREAARLVEQLTAFTRR